MAPPRLFPHLPRTMLERHGPGGFGLYEKLIPDFRKMEIEVEVVERPSTTELAHYTKTDFHLVHHGFLRRFNVLNCGMAYLWRYWYLDRRGVLCDSSLARAKPDLARIDPKKAQDFLGHLQKRYVRRGASRYTQPDRKGDLGRGAIVVFLQGMGDPVLRNMHMMETEMLDLVMRHRAGRAVLIKPHPKWPDTVASAHAQALTEQHEDVAIVDANVHDLLAGAHCSVSICSGASFEGLMHRTPAILFGQSDFHHCAWTVTDAAEAEAAFAGIRDRSFPYEAFLFWFLRQKMHDVFSPDLGARVLRRINQTGFTLKEE